MSDISYGTSPPGYTDITDVTETRSVNNDNRIMDRIRRIDILNVIGIVAALISAAFISVLVKKIT